VKEVSDAIATTSELERLVDLSVDMLCVTTLSSRFLVLNPAWTLTLGWSEEELRGRRAIDLVHPDDRDGLLAQAARLTEPGTEVHEHELRARHRDGSYRWLTWSSRSDGERLYALVRDVTDRKLADEALRKDITDRRVREQALRASEERYRNIVETTSEGVWMIDADHHTTYVNRRMAEMLGYTVAEMLGRPVGDFVPAGRRTDMEVGLQRRRSGVSEQREGRYVRKDGSEMWALMSGSPLTNGNGGYGGALAMVSDITERKRAEFELARLAAIVESSPDAIFSTDMEGTLTSWNRAAEELYGYTQEEAVGQSAYILAPPDQMEMSRQLAEFVKRGGSQDAFRTVALRKDGTRIDVEPSVSAIESRDGVMLGVLAIVRAG
jgi:PAS domain S-box-containing protein